MRGSFEMRRRVVVGWSAGDQTVPGSCLTKISSRATCFLSSSFSFLIHSVESTASCW